MDYTKVFNPISSNMGSTDGPTSSTHQAADLRDGSIYVYSERIILAVNVALATHRPLLIRGPSGSGKSSLAASVAQHMGWRYYEEVISSRTQARDLLWQFDSLRRLSDTQANRTLQEDAYYIEPGVLWWAFDPTSAERRGGSEELRHTRPALDPSPRGAAPAVVLLDEIDKADPDVPNDLLVPLGSLEFDVTDANQKVHQQHNLLLIITTNDERQLPSALLRRCVILELPNPDKDRLVAIARAHFGPSHHDLYNAIADQVLEQEHTKRKTSSSLPSTAEFLDTIRACLDLGVDPNHEIWQELSMTTLWKSQGVKRSAV